MAHLLLHHGVSATLRHAVDHLIVGQHGTQLGTPVHHRLAQVGDAVVHQYLLLLLLAHGLPLGSGELQVLRAGSVDTLRAVLLKVGYQTFDRHGLALDIVVVGAEHADEGPLCPMIVFGVAGAYLAVPIERETDLVQLLTVAGNVLHGGDGGVLPRLYGILLGRESVGIVTHGVEYVVALRALVAGIDVRGDVAQRMAHMESRP